MPPEVRNSGQKVGGTLTTLSSQLSEAASFTNTEEKTFLALGQWSGCNYNLKKNLFNNLEQCGADCSLSRLQVHMLFPRLHLSFRTTVYFFSIFQHHQQVIDAGSAGTLISGG